MGEYATLRSTGDRIKIGTCEDMYYLRHDQLALVRGEEGSVDPSRDTSIRFRFPFPQEDNKPPGSFEPFYGLEVPGVTAPRDCDHYSVQFSARGNNGFGSYLVSLPCPNGPDSGKIGHKVHRNGIGSEVKIVQQRPFNGELWTVCECTACGSKWRCDRKSAEELAVALRSYADQQNGQGDYWHTVADRVLAGYTKSEVTP